MTKPIFPQAWMHIEHEGVTHFIPAKDIREHTPSMDCWCNPHSPIDPEVVEHRSGDHREEYENEIRKFN